MEVETVILPADLRNWRPTIFPGSQGGGNRVVSTAGGFGRTFGGSFGYTVITQITYTGRCTCPVQTAWPGALVYDVDCPVHTPEKRLPPRLPLF